jgi:hydrogenase maturation protease
MCRIIVVGLGNPLRGDDGMGWYAVDRLAEIFHEKEIEFVKCRELMPEFSEKISKAKYVLFIDASVKSEGITQKGKGETIGEMKIVASENHSSVETHQLDPGGLLAFSSALYGKTPEGIMLTVKGESFEYVEKLSKKVQQSVLSLITRAREILNQWRENLQVETRGR